MKKILLTGIAIILSFNLVSADTFTNPEKNGNIIGYYDSDDNSTKQATLEMFCIDNDFNFLESYIETSSNTGAISYYSTTSYNWSAKLLSDTTLGQKITEITCINSDGSASNLGGTAATWSGSIDTRDYLQLLVYKNGETYINQDTFTYLLVISLVGILLLKTIILVFTKSFMATFTLYGNRIGKK